jgi:ankyrin repeat protein
MNKCNQFGMGGSCSICRKDTFLELAIKSKDEELVKIVLSNDKVNPSEYNNSALLLACYNGPSTIVKILLNDKRLKLKSNDIYLFFAWDYGYIFHMYYYNETSIIELIKDGRIDITACDNLLIKAVCKQNHIDTLKCILQKMKLTDKVLYELLIIALKKNNKDIINELRKYLIIDPLKNLNINYKDLMELLKCALVSGHREIIDDIRKYSIIDPLIV